MITCLNFASDISTHCPCIPWLGRYANKSKDKIIIKNKNVCFWPHWQFTSLFSFCDLFLWLVPPVTSPHGTQVFEQIVEANEDKTSPMYFSLCGWFELLLSWNTWTLFKIYFWLHLITVVNIFVYFPLSCMSKLENAILMFLPNGLLIRSRSHHVSEMKFDQFGHVFFSFH